MVDLVEGSSQPVQVWRDCYDQVLAPSFPADELVGEQDFVAARERPTSRVLFALDAGAPVGLSMVDSAAVDAPVALLSYLATHPTRRARGVGSMLMQQVRAHEPMLLIEIEDPREHGERGFGDPWRRVEFYRRHGVRALQVPYFQPPVAPGHPRVDGMLLGLLTPGPVPDTVDAGPVRDYLVDYLRSSGEDLEQPPASTLLAALTGSMVRVVDLPAA
ncbi:GNAT family N-acetyltransferase [Serinicoccus kebangsaanensis]|uniref:GNAT family N-acetyltransferase n=1 Tax=Serinicoccus kebangsaanensis TaxID=2602069 RepID=UPI00178C542D|nr:GNAT family N-acetyltransferase [Serinicoccus kebangsaanensis]